MRRDNFFAGFNGCDLRRGDFRRRNRRAVLWTTDNKRLRRRSSPRTVFSAGVSRDLSARPTLTQRSSLRPHGVACVGLLLGAGSRK